MRIAQKFLVACLISLPTIAFADVYPLNPPPDVFIDGFTYTGATLTGTVESITDIGNCSTIPCATTDLTFFATSSGFTITDASNDVYLAGDELAATVGTGGEAGLLYSITTDNNALWSAVEGQTASSFGSEIAVDLHNFDVTTTSGLQPTSDADLTPYTNTSITTTPEPASMTLLLTGLAAGYVRKRRAAKQS